jgi:hypothetical protein
MPILGTKTAHQIVADKGAKTIFQRLGIQKTGNSSSANDQNPTSKSAQKGPTSNNAVQPGNTEMLASSMMDSTNPNYNPSIRDFRKKKKTQEQQKSSFLSEGTLLEELLDSGHPLNKRFIKFVEDHYAQNEVALLGLTLRYKNTQDSKERAKLGKTAVKDFIEDGASRQVDLPQDLRDIIVSSARRNQWATTSFDEIRRNLMFDLKGNFLGKFEKQLEIDARKTDL